MTLTELFLNRFFLVYYKKQDFTFVFILELLAHTEM